MRLIIIALCACAAALAQSYPGTTATNQVLTVPPIESPAPISYLTAGITDSTLTLHVADGTRYRQYNIIRINNAEQAQICSIATNTLTLCEGSRGYCSTTPAAANTRAPVRAIVSSCAVAAMNTEIKAIEESAVPSFDVAALPDPCIPTAHYTLNTDKTLHRCNATGDGYDTIASGGGSGSGDAATTPSVTYSATPTFTCNANTSTTFRITLTGNVTSSTLASPATGQLMTFRICQDGTGGHTFVWPTSVLNAGTIDATASACSTQTFVWDGTFAQALGTMLVTGPAGGVITLNNSSSGTTTVAAPATGTNALTLPSNNGVILSTLSLPGTSLAGPVKAKVCSGVGSDYVVQNINTDASVDCVQMTGGGGGSSTAQGTAASIPGTCTTGNLYFPTNSLYTVLRCSATNTWSYFFDGQTVTPPSGTWAWDHATGLGGSTASVDTTRVYWSLTAPMNTHQGTDLSLYYAAAPAAPFTRAFALRPNVPASPTGQQGWYVGFEESSTGKFVVFAAEAPNGDGYRGKYGTYKGTSTTNLSPGFDYSQQAPGGMNLFNGNVWVRITDNNTNLIFELSFDGQFFTVLQTVSRTAHMAGGPDRIVVGLRNGNSGGTVTDIFLNIVGIQ